MITRNHYKNYVNERNVADERSDRTNKRVLSAFFDKEVYKEFKILSAAQLKTTDAMLHEAVALLFRKHNRPLPDPMRRKLKRLGID